MIEATVHTRDDGYVAVAQNSDGRDVDPGPAVRTLPGTGYALLKLDRAGELEWTAAIRPEPGASVLVGDVTETARGLVAVGTLVGGRVTFDDPRGGAHADADRSTCFVARYDLEHVVTLTTFTGQSSGCGAQVVSVLADGSFVVAGGAGSDVQFPIAPAVPAAKGGLFAAEFSADGAPRRTLVFPSARAFVDRVIPLPTGGYWVVGDHSGPIDLDPGAAVAERELAPDAQTQLFGSRVDSSGAFVAGWSLEGSYLTLQDAVVDRAGALVVSGRATSSPEHLQPWVDLDPGPATMKQAGESFYVVKLDGSTLLGSRAWAGRVYGWLVALPDGDLLVPGAFRGVASFGEPGGAARSANEHAAFFMRLTPALAVRSLTTFGDSETEVLLPRASSSGFVVTGHAIREADGVPAPREKAHGSWSFVSTYAF